MPDGVRKLFSKINSQLRKTIKNVSADTQLTTKLMIPGVNSPMVSTWYNRRSKYDDFINLGRPLRFPNLPLVSQFERQWYYKVGFNMSCMTKMLTLFREIDTMVPWYFFLYKYILSVLNTKKISLVVMEFLKEKQIWTQCGLTKTRVKLRLLEGL